MENLILHDFYRTSLFEIKTFTFASLMSDILLPYSIDLAALMIRGHQTNPLIRDFLRQFSEPFDPNSTINCSKVIEEEYELLETGLMHEEAIGQIRRNLRHKYAEFTARMFLPVKPPSPRKSTIVKQTKAQQNLEREAAEKRREQEKKKELNKTRKAQIAKKTTIDDVREAEKEHQKFLDKIGIKKFVEEKTESKENQAKRNRENQMKFGASTLAKNKEVLPNTIRPIRGVNPVKEEKLPPRATDLANYSKRVSAEVKKLIELKEMILSEEHQEISTVEAFQRIEQIEVVEYGSEPPDDYHMQLAMLFQKLENAEQKIRELDDKTEMLQ